MYKHRINEQVGLKTQVDWFLLAFLAGTVNTGGYLACHRFVTHVTGFATLAGVDAAAGKWQDAVGILTVPIYFLFGVMISAYLIDHRVQAGKKPRYVWVMSAVTILLAAAGIIGEIGWFGPFGSELELHRDYILALRVVEGKKNSIFRTDFV